MTDGPEIEDRRAEGYRVAARIESRSSNRARLLAILAGLVVVLWAAAVVNGRLAPAPGPSDVARSSQQAQPTDGTGIGPGPTFPPDIELVQPTAPFGRQPVVLGGLAFLDLRTGSVDRSLSLDLGQWRFTVPSGTACVCLEGADGVSPASLHLYEWNRAGVPSWANSFGGWLASDQRITIVDAAPMPDGASAIVASVVEDGSRWDLRLQRVPLGSEGPVAEGDVRSIDLAALGDPARLQLRVFVAPDARHVRVTFQQLADDLAAVQGREHTWVVPLDANGFGAFADAPSLPVTARPGLCPSQAWATPDLFAQLCQSPELDDDALVPTFVRLFGPADEFQEVPVGSVQQFEPIGWLVDGRRGAIYAWAPLGHQITRVTAATGEASYRIFAGPHGAPGDALRAVTPDGPNPAPRPDPAIWQPLEPASATTASPLVGSVDGSLLYAAGYGNGEGSIASPGAIDSTGVWVFDAATLALVAHWPAAAGYESLGLETGGKYLVATGTPTTSEVAAFGNHGPELAVHDLSDGSVVVIQRELILRFGGMPYLLPAGPG